MSVSIIDGTLEAVTVKRRAAKLWRLADVRLVGRDGVETVLRVAAVSPEVGAALQPGTKGRFYLYKTVDHQGIHAVRPEGGTLIASYPTTNETLMITLFVINIVVIAAMVAINNSLPLLALLLLPFTGVLYFLYRATRIEAEAQLAAERSQ